MIASDADTHLDALRKDAMRHCSRIGAGFEVMPGRKMPAYMWAVVIGAGLGLIFFVVSI